MVNRVILPKHIIQLCLMLFPLNMCSLFISIFHKAQPNSHVSPASTHLYFPCHTLANYFVPLSTSIFYIIFVLLFSFIIINVISLTNYYIIDSWDNVFWRGKVKYFVGYPSIWLVFSHIYRELWIWGKNITKVKCPLITWYQGIHDINMTHLLMLTLITLLKWYPTASPL